MCGKQREPTAPIQSLVKLQHLFLNLRWKICLRQNCNLGSCVCSEGPALGQNTLMMMMMMMMIENCIHIQSLFKQCLRVNYQHTIKSEVTWKWMMYVARIQMMSPVALHKSRRFTIFILLPTLSFISGCSHLLLVNLSG